MHFTNLIVFHAEIESLDQKYDQIKDAETRKHNEAVLLRLAEALNPGGTIEFQEPSDSKSDDLKSLLTICGFEGAEIENVQDAIRVTARKPEWEGTSAKLSFKKTKKNDSTNDAVASAWKLGADDLVDVDEFCDEDDLLNDEDLIVNVGNEADNDDCGTGDNGVKKACANCVCGRAESQAVQSAQERAQSLLDSGAAKVEGGKMTIDTAKLKEGGGGCGSCQLGDAYRCAGCPSAGLPAYSVGEKIVIDLE